MKAVRTHGMRIHMHWHKTCKAVKKTFNHNAADTVIKFGHISRSMLDASKPCCYRRDWDIGLHQLVFQQTAASSSVSLCPKLHACLLRPRCSKPSLREMGYNVPVAEDTKQGQQKPNWTGRHACLDEWSCWKLNHALA